MTQQKQSQRYSDDTTRIIALALICSTLSLAFNAATTDQFYSLRAWDLSVLRGFENMDIFLAKPMFVQVLNSTYSFYYKAIIEGQHALGISLYQMGLLLFFFGQTLNIFGFLHLTQTISRSSVTIWLVGISAIFHIHVWKMGGMPGITTSTLTAWYLASGVQFLAISFALRNAYIKSSMALCLATLLHLPTSIGLILSLPILAFFFKKQIPLKTAVIAVGIVTIGMAPSLLNAFRLSQQTTDIPEILIKTANTLTWSHTSLVYYFNHALKHLLIFEIPALVLFLAILIQQILKKNTYSSPWYRLLLLSGIILFWGITIPLIADTFFSVRAVQLQAVRYLWYIQGFMTIAFTKIVVDYAQANTRSMYTILITATAMGMLIYGLDYTSNIYYTAANAILLLGAIHIGSHFTRAVSCSPKSALWITGGATLVFAIFFCAIHKTPLNLIFSDHPHYTISSTIDPDFTAAINYLNENGELAFIVHPPQQHHLFYYNASFPGESLATYFQFAPLSSAQVEHAMKIGSLAQKLPNNEGLNIDRLWQEMPPEIYPMLVNAGFTHIIRERTATLNGLAVEYMSERFVVYSLLDNSKPTS